MLRKKYKKCKEGTANDVKNIGVETCILKIELMATSKIKDHFIYEVCYLDQGEIKQTNVVGKNITNVIDIISPYVNTGTTEQWTQFQLGSEEAIRSRMKKN
jgi:hypothetical protein